MELQGVITPVVGVAKCGLFSFSWCERSINGGQTVFQEVLFGMLPKTIGNNALDEESVILECCFYIIYSLKRKMDIMV